MELTRYKPEILESALGGRNCAAMAEHENGAWYHRREVDALLAEKDAEIQSLKQKAAAYTDAKAPAVNEKWHYKFEDLKPVTGRDIDMGHVDGEGCLDPNDEYYPRQKVDAAVCELDARRLCFDTDRKYYMGRYDYFLKKSMAYENRLLHSDYRRSCRILKHCREKLLEWQRLSTIFCKPKSEGFELAKAKIALWTKWEARWQEIVELYR